MSRKTLLEEANEILGGPGKEFRRQALHAFIANLEDHIIGEIKVKRNLAFDVFYLTSYGIAFAKDSKVRRDREQQWRWFRQLKDGSLKPMEWKQVKNRVYYVDNKEAVRATQKVWKENNPNYHKEYYKDDQRSRIDVTDTTDAFGREIVFDQEKAFVVAPYRIDSLKNRLKKEREQTSPKGWKKAEWTPKDRFLFYLKPAWALATDDKLFWLLYRFEAGKWRKKSVPMSKAELLFVIRETVSDENYEGVYPKALKKIQSWPAEYRDWLKQHKEK